MSRCVSNSIRIVAAGACCALGYNMDAISCALRAGLDHFQESEFGTSGGEPVRIARLPDGEHWGAERLANWLRHALSDCLAALPQLSLESIPLFLITLESERPHGAEHAQFETALHAQQSLGLSFHPDSRIVAGGRAGLGMALEQIGALFATSNMQRALLVGVDSYLNAASINHYLAAKRLLVPGNSDGFLPGEGAAALLLENCPAGTQGLHIAGVGRGQAEGRPDGSIPSRARGLTRAMRAALTQAGLTADTLHFRVSDQNGEAFFAREAANALTRIAVPGTFMPSTLTTADCSGEIGATTGPLMLAWLSHIMPKSDGPGHCGLIHLANDNGERSAVIVRYLP
ncbi:hypothetical protein [Pseudomonas paralcaligenes]|uniref:hypothetical protein n=1 Tax=Pseudomonas paralcaligenes TaxID=2772558 RepID=UPI001C819C6A|nr:hypothetical protein [Pseudomonas paralcaligenes]